VTENAIDVIDDSIRIVLQSLDVLGFFTRGLERFVSGLFYTFHMVCSGFVVVNHDDMFAVVA